MLLSRKAQGMSVSGVTRPISDLSQYVPFMARRAGPDDATND
jgi:hypothetical protein